MSINVFLVDDHKLVRDGLRALLADCREINVVGDAADGREAVKQAIALKPDVVLMDVAMPGLNGIEATREIAERLPQTRVIMLSMYSNTEYVFRSLKAGARGYLLKESIGTDVANAIRVVYSGKRYLSSKVSEQVLDDYVTQRDQLQQGDPLSLLSPRERQVLQFVVEGKSSTDIATELFISSTTVDTYRSRLMRKIGTSDVPGLVKFALRHGLTSIE